MGHIGEKPFKKVTLEPLPEPDIAPVEQPVAPEPAAVPVPEHAPA